MSLQFLKADSADAVALAGISALAFDSDITVGAANAGGPPGYAELSFHKEMAKMNCLYKLVDDGKIVGGAILFLQGDEVNVGRIFVSPEFFRKGYGIFMMQQIEMSFPNVKRFTLDTPVWNVRTNAFYKKLGYREARRDDDCVYYEKISEDFMTKIKYVEMADKEFWFTLDRHLPEKEFENKVSAKQGYVLLENDKPVGLLRYNLFWDNTPFCTMLFIDWSKQKKGYGKQLLEYWEKDMKSQGFDFVLTSTRVDESAQHFYRKLGYKDCGGLLIDIPNYEQPMEMFLIKRIRF